MDGKKFDIIYDTGDTPRAQLKSILILIAKKAVQTMRLLKNNQLQKPRSSIIFEKNPYMNIQQLHEQHIKYVILVWRSSRGFIGTFQVLFGRKKDVDCDVYVCLIDYQEPFDKLQHNYMIEDLRIIISALGCTSFKKTVPKPSNSKYQSGRVTYKI